MSSRSVSSRSVSSRSVSSRSVSSSSVSGRSRSALFLIEQLIVVTIFAVCASVCVKIFVGSYLMAKDTRDMNRALIAAKNGAECFKAYGDLGKTAYALNEGEHGMDGSPDAAVVYYDAAWRVCGAAEAASPACCTSAFSL